MLICKIKYTFTFENINGNIHIKYNYILIYLFIKT